MLAFQDHFTSRSSSFRWADSWEREVIQPQHNDRRPSTSPASFPAAPVRVSSSRPSSIRSPTTLPPSPWTLESSVPSIQYIFTSYPSALPSPAVTSRSPTRVPYLAPSAAPSEIPTAQPSTYQPSSSSDPSSAPTLVPTASTRPSTSLPSYLPSLVPTEYVTWQPSPLPSFAPTTKSSTSTAPSKELPFSRSLSFYSSNFTETPPDLSSLDFLIESTLLLHYSSDELNVTWVSSKLNAVQPSVRGVSPLVEQELDLRQYVVNSTIFYKMLYADSDAQLTSSLATQQLQQSLRTVAGSQQQAEYEYMVVCSEDSIQDCLYNATVSGDSNREGWTFCDKDAQDWQELYNNPSSCPFSLFWYFSLLIVYCWMLLKAFYEMCFAAKLHTYLHVSSTLASINCCVLRGLYFAYILSAVLNDDTFDRVACTELNFLEEDFDPTYALLQALVYLALLCAVTLHVEARATRTGQSKSCLPSLIFASVLGLCFWLLYVICMVYFEDKEPFPGFASLRVSSQCFVGLTIILLGGYLCLRFSYSAFELLQGVVLVCTGIDTAATAFEALYTVPMLSFWMYTVAARVLEILSLWYLLQYDSRDRSLAAQEHVENLAIGLSASPRRSSSSAHATYGDVKEIMHRVRLRLEGYSSNVSDDNGFITDRVFPIAPQPTWIEHWRDRAIVPIASASVMLSRLSLRREQAMEQEEMHLNTETEESRERQSRKRPRINK